MEEAIKTILGHTPTFVGVMGKEVDSAIVMKQGPNNNDLQTKVCNATHQGETSGLSCAMNSGE